MDIFMFWVFLLITSRFALSLNITLFRMYAHWYVYDTRYTNTTTNYMHDDHEEIQM